MADITLFDQFYHTNFSLRNPAPKRRLGVVLLQLFNRNAPRGHARSPWKKKEAPGGWQTLSYDSILNEPA